ncbi:IclR family transcriptional regulator [Arthrobacter ginkgonis]|uniref:IclR family transcriptional regulator n=1 Tax=Arthrobacter ginkgonis TaxID=1630594 RepID=A0ABP7BRW1_9MICC
MTKQGEREAPAYPIGSVDKALRLLLLVAERSGGLRIGEASTLLGVAPSTAHRLLQMLAHYGFAEQDPESKAYAAGPAIRRLRNSRARILEIARPVLEDLVEATQETVHLAALEQGMAVTLLSVESPHLLRVGDRSGHSQPAYLSAMGKALLADLDAGALAELFPEGFERGRAESVEELSAVLDEVRSLGYSFQDGEVESGVSALAVPVRGAGGAVEFAIGITYPSGRIPASGFGRAVAAAQNAAAALAAALQA